MGSIVRPSLKTGRMDSAQFDRSVVHGKGEWLGEGCNEVDKVTPSKLSFTNGAETQNTIVIANDVSRQHVG